MKRYLIALTLLVVLLPLGQASRASAEPLWLINGAGVGGLGEEVDGIGELEFVDLKTPVGEIAVKCGLDYHGTVNTMGKDQAKELLDRSSKLIEELKGSGLACVSVKTCENTTDIELWPEHLPINTQLENVLIGGKEATLDRYFKSGTLEPGFTILCLVADLNFEDTCLGPTSAIVENERETVRAEFDGTEQEANAEQLKCSQRGEKSGQIKGMLVYEPTTLTFSLKFDK